MYGTGSHATTSTSTHDGRKALDLAYSSNGERGVFYCLKRDNGDRFIICFTSFSKLKRNMYAICTKNASPNFGQPPSWLADSGMCPLRPFYSSKQIANKHTNVNHAWKGRQNSVVRVPDSWLEGRGFESRQKRLEIFLLQT